MIEKPDIK